MSHAGGSNDRYEHYGSGRGKHGHSSTGGTRHDLGSTRHEPGTTRHDYDEGRYPPGDRMPDYPRWLAEREREIAEEREENERMRRTLREAEGKIEKQDINIRTLLGVCEEQIAHIERLKADNTQLFHHNEQLASKNTSIHGDVTKVLTGKDDAVHRLRDAEHRMHMETLRFTNEIERKNHEIEELDRRLRHAIDKQRLAENEMGSHKFQLETIRDKYDAELKQKELFLEGMRRDFEASLENKRKEVADLARRVDHLVEDNKVMLDQNKFLRREIERLQDIIGSLKDGRRIAPGQPASAVGDSSEVKRALTAGVELAARNSSQRLEFFAFQVWRLRFQMRQRPPTEMRAVTDLPRDLLDVVKRLRDYISTTLFELFVRSNENAATKKGNSLVLFIVNLREYRDRHRSCIEEFLFIYEMVRKKIKALVPNFGRLPDMIDMKKLAEEGEDFEDGHVERSNFSKYVAGTIAQIIARKGREGRDPSRFLTALFRFLTLKYRIRYPVRGPGPKVDPDLLVYLDHKIVAQVGEAILTLDDRQFSLERLPTGQAPSAAPYDD